MYRKKAGGWLKHLDFMLLDMLCLQAAFMLAYAVRMGPSSPYGDEAYRSIGVVLLLADMVVLLLTGTFSGVLARGRYEEFVVTLRHVCLVEAVAVMYLFTVQKNIAGSRFVIYLMAVLYVSTGYFTSLAAAAQGCRRGEALPPGSDRVGHGCGSTGKCHGEGL